jgi:hypothetical protein
MPPQASWYRSLGDTFASHEAVNHSLNEYARYMALRSATLTYSAPNLQRLASRASA